MNDLKLPYCYKHLSLDYIMDDNNTHIYIDLVIHLLIQTNQQCWRICFISEIEKAVEKTSWAQEPVLKNQVEELQQQLANAQIHSGLQQRYTYILSLLIIISEAVLIAFKITLINLRTWAVVFQLTSHVRCSQTPKIQMSTYRDECVARYPNRWL